MKRNLFLSLFVALWLVSCGYKPSSQMIAHIFEKSVYVEVAIDRAEPENASYVKDELNRLVYTRFKGRVVSKEEAQSKIHISYGGSTFLPIAYTDGYVTRYLATIMVKFEMETKQGTLKKTVVSTVESDIEGVTATSSALRTEAIKTGLGKALDEFLAFVSAKGILKEPK